MKFRLLPLCLMLILPGISFGQAERHELGRRLRLFEDAWELQKDGGKRKEPAEAMNNAVLLFFAGRLGDAGKELDKGISGLSGRPGSATIAEIHGLWLKAESHWLDSSKDKVKVKVARFYSVKDGKLKEVSYSYSWLPTNKQTSGAAPILEATAPVTVPGEMELTLPREAGDYVLQINWKTLNGEKAELGAEYFTISKSDKRDERLARIKEAFAGWETSKAIDQSTVAEQFKLLSKLAFGESLETDYPADRLLKECEEATESIARKQPYYTSGRTGQYWLTFSTAAKGVVRVRIQMGKAEPGKKVPVLLALHGAGGSENLFFDGYGHGKIGRLAAERGWFVVAPRNSVSKAGHAETIAELAKVFPEMDTDCVLVVGHSMGAAEAIREANKTPDKFAALAALGGGGSPKPAQGQEQAFKKLPYYVGIGENDFGRSRAQALAKELKKLGATSVTLKQFDGIEHMIIVQEALPEVFKFFDSIVKARDGK